MRAAVSLLKHGLGFTRMQAATLRFSFKNKQKEAIQLMDQIEYNIPKCRFIQFTRAGDSSKHIGMVSENGIKFIDLTDVSCVASDMIQFIQQKYCMDNLLDNTKYMEVHDIKADLRLLPPIQVPGKIIGVAHNYRDNCEEENHSIPKVPEFFVKFNSCITGALDHICAHRIAKRIDYGCQLAVVIGSKCRNVSRKAALGHVFGYMIAQDITARDWKAMLGGQTMLCKSLDSFLPLGPVLVHKCHVPDVNNLWIKTIVNGEEKQYGNTKDMIFKIDYLIHRLSQFMTLLPGDIILTGTPGGVGAFRNPTTFLKPGDLIESEIQKLGKMQNKVINPFT